MACRGFDRAYGSAILAAVLAVVVVNVGQAQAARRLNYDPTTDPNWPNRKQADNQHFGEWGVGRSTFAYNEDGMDLNNAACSFGTIDPSVGLGLQVAAISDANPDYAGSCGRCYEMKCVPMTFTDGLNNTLDRQKACISPKSIVVKIVDTCPCNYPQNAVSNQRWCCGDMTHFDTSYWAVSRLADPKYGVFGINYRQVPCDFAPAENAGPVGWPANYTSTTSGDVGTGMDSMEPDPRPPVISESNMATTRNGSITLSIVSNSPRPDNSTAANTSASPSISPSMPASSATNSSAGNSSSSDLNAPSGGVTPIYKDGSFQSSFSDASWKTTVTRDSNEGLNNGAAFCGKVSSYGGLAMRANPGKFKGMLSLQFYIKGSDNSSMPTISVKIASDSGACNAVPLSSLTSSGSADGWKKYEVFLGNFVKSGPSSDQQVTAFAPAFTGCGSIPVEKLTRVEFDNNSKNTELFCVDQVYLLG